MIYPAGCANETIKAVRDSLLAAAYWVATFGCEKFWLKFPEIVLVLAPVSEYDSVLRPVIRPADIIQGNFPQFSRRSRR
jgi:hypothetical protein